MWTGMVFTSPYPPANNPEIGYYVSVPPYYAEADAWLSQQPGEFRIISLPIPPGDGITCKWAYGYSGVEPSYVIFGRPFISRLTWVPHVDSVVKRLEKAFISTPEFWKYMALLNAKYIVIRSDIDYIESKMRSPEDINRAIKYTISPNIVNGEVVYTSTPLVQRLADKHNIQNWAKIWYTANATLTTDVHDARQSTNSIVLNSGLVQMPEGDFAIAFSCRLPEDRQDWSNASFFEVWLKSNIAGAIVVSVTDSQGHYINWDGQREPVYFISNGEVNSWKLFVFPFDTPTTRDREFNLNAVSRIMFFIIAEENSTVATIKVSGLFTDAGKIIKVKHINYVRSFGKLDFYKIDDECFLDRIYATNQFIFSDNVDRMLFEDVLNDSFDPRDRAIFLLSQSNINNITLLTSLRTNHLYKPAITFEKVNPTKYFVNVQNASYPFFLIFSESYHPQWKAYINGSQISDKYHFIANGYANAWYVDKTGAFEIVLEFWPQKLVHTGSLLSSMTFVLCVLCLSKNQINIFRRQSAKKNANLNKEDA
jgi:hypothetical protein